MCVDLNTGRAYFKRVSKKWNSTPRRCEAIFVQTAVQMVASNELQPQQECIRPAFMLLTDAQFKLKEIEKERERRKRVKGSGSKSPAGAGNEEHDDPGQARLDQRDAEYEVIRPLVTKNAIFATFNPYTSHAVIAARAQEVGCSLQHVERLVHRFGWFGLEPNALLRLNENKGPKQVLRQTRTGPKRGRPNAWVVVKRTRTFEGVNVTYKDISKFEVALKTYHIDQDLTLERTYELMCDEMYVGMTRLASGELIRRSIKRRFVPTIEQFLYWHKQFWTPEKRAAKAGPQDAAALTSNQIGDTAISPEVADVYDIDATEFNRELVADFIDNGQTVNIGKATVVLVFDRRSRKVVGWYVYAGNENWEVGYRLAIFRTLSSDAKQQRLKFLKIESVDSYPLWPENPKPRYLYSDNGPNSSKAAQLAQARLGIAPLLAPPGYPHWKPTVEGGLGNLQRRHAKLSGGWERTRRSRDKLARAKAKLMADKTLYEFEQKLTLQIIEYNAKLSMHHMLSYEMTRDGVDATADAIFSWGVRRIGGIQNRILDNTTIYLALLNLKEGASLTKDGIRLNTAHYSCEELLKLYEQGVRSVNLVYHPFHKEEVFWVNPDGVLCQLLMNERDAARHGTRSVTDVNLLKVHQRMQVVKAAKSGKSTGLTKRMEGVLKKQEQPQRQRNAPTKGQSTYRKAQAQIHRDTDTTDRTATHIPEVAAQKTAVPSSRRTAPVDSSPMAHPAPSPAASHPSQDVSARPPAATRPTATAPLLPTEHFSPPAAPYDQTNERFSSASRWEEEEEDDE